MRVSDGLNAQGGDITIKNARVWTGDPRDPWKEGITVRDGRIAALDANEPAGRVFDAGGRLVTPSFWDGHTHPHVPFVLVSPGSPSLLHANSAAEVLEILRGYVETHPDDRYPRLMGWRTSLFERGGGPTRQMIDEVVSDRPVYLVHYSGNTHWANTKALELAGVLEKPEKEMKGPGRVERDPDTGLATGYMEETELAATLGVMLDTVKEIQPQTFKQQVDAQHSILEHYNRFGITSIWTKDGTIENTRFYEQMLREDRLNARPVLNCLYTPFHEQGYLEEIRDRGLELESLDLPGGFIRGNSVKLTLDLVMSAHQTWLFEPYSDGSGTCGKPVYPIDEFQELVNEADRLGLQINTATLGDRAVHECLNAYESAAKANPPRTRRHALTHAELIIDEDIPRIPKLGVVIDFNPLVSYPEESHVRTLEKFLGPERLQRRFHRWKDLIEAGAVVTAGSDYPVAPFDPFLQINVMVNGTDAFGQPEGGLWPQQHISVENALRMFTVNPARATYREDVLGMLKVGYCGDFVVLSRDILDPGFDTGRLVHTKVNLTVFNGHVVHEDPGDEKDLEFTPY
jgi:predicted amidohydrolase YtcJ